MSVRNFWIKHWIVKPEVTRKEVKEEESIFQVFGTVQNVYDNGIVQNVYDNGIVQNVYDNGIVQSDCGNGIVQSVCGNGIKQNRWNTN